MSYADLYCMDAWIIGALGLLGISLAWFVETVHVLQRKKTSIPLAFSLVYVCASLLLVAYSVMVGDVIFVLLNVFATLSALMHVYVTVRYR